MSNTAPAGGTSYSSESSSDSSSQSSSDPPDTTRTTTTSTTGARPATGEGWPHQATSAIVDLVDTVRSRTTGPATTVARGIVYGLLAGVLGVAAAVLLAVVATRGLILGVDALLSLGDLDLAGRAVWISELAIGAVAILVGAVVWRKGLRPRPT